MNISVIGYGTFITQGHWKDKKNVEVCKVPNFIRIYPKGNWYPFVLPLENSSFWALKFDVNEEQLKQLDYYEGVHTGLFERYKTKIILKNHNYSEAFIYVPTQKTITSLNLSPQIDLNDRWKEKIKRNSEIMLNFPELML
ncbi:MAG: gamma-glutamylcyclotransferase family protein [Promethearchaeota archaeon]